MTTVEDFLANDQQAPAKIRRDRWSRPLVMQPSGDRIAYTRASTLGKALDDEAGLTAWKMRLTAVGVAKRKDLILAVNAHFADKTAMSGIVEQAMDAAEAGAAATSGTALHELMDATDHGRDPYVPEEYRADIAAYREATKGLEFIRSEVFVVDDELQVAGTYDNLFRLKAPATTPDGTVLPKGTYLTTDKKTGQGIQYGHCSWSVQLSCYSHGRRYDAATESRLETEPVNLDWGLIVHAPVGKGTAQLYWIDLRKGRELAKLAATVRTQRKAKTMVAATIEPPCIERIPETTSLEALRELWTEARQSGELTEQFQSAAGDHARSLT
jgi:hypothetical protein